MFLLIILPLNMQAVSYKIFLVKKSAQINRQNLSEMVKDIFTLFGGESLMSNISIACQDDNTFEVNCPKESMHIIRGALALNGKYKGIPCCFREF